MGSALHLQYEQLHKCMSNSQERIACKALLMLRTAFSGRPMLISSRLLLMVIHYTCVTGTIFLRARDLELS